jgi:type IV pilus assembly protein PilA
MLKHPNTQHRSEPARQHGIRARDRLVARVTDSSGFSLIELLVVFLIIAVLAAILIPSFLSSTAKASDAQVKELVRTAETTAEAIAVANDGKYAKVTLEELKAAEPAIETAVSKSHAYVLKTTHGENEYAITAKGTNGDEFTIGRDASGTITRSCVSPPGKTDCGGKETSSW